MGREIKRVPLDFDWELDKTWEGFLNPHYRDCPDCESGSTASADVLDQLVRLLLLAGEQSCAPPQHMNNPNLIFPHPYLKAIGISSKHQLGDTLHEVTTGLAGRPPSSPFGHVSCDSWAAKKAILKAAGLDEKWGWCPNCGGDDLHPDCKEAYEAWEETPVPEGEGWQLWETVSEGSPVSPVFVSPEKLIDWMCSPDAVRARNSLDKEPWSRAAAESFVRGSGWAPSFMSTPDGKVTDGVEACGEGE